MNGRLKPFLICLFILVWATHAIAEVNLTSLVKKLQPAVGTILTYDKDNKFLGQGSGFFIDADGHLITNYHVLRGAYQAEVKTQDGKKYPITSVIAENKAMDLIKVSANIPRTSFQWLNVTGALPAIAERIVVIGSPMGLAQTISEGIVSGVREIPNRGKILQISAPISPGSSGSPVVNMKGQVIGVATFYLMKGQSLNFAIPAQYLIDLKSVGTGKALTAWTKDAAQTPVRKKARKNFLVVDTKPEWAKIRILNIKPKFYQGIILNPGSYHVEVSANGFEMKRVWIKIKPGENKLLKISLTKLPDILTGKIQKLDSLGWEYIRKEEWGKAVEVFKQIIHIDPNNADGHRALGCAYNGLSYWDGVDRYQEAIKALKQAIRLDPDDSLSYSWLGHAYDGLGSYMEAIQAYKQCISIDPDDQIGNCYLSISESYTKMDSYHEAIAALKQWIRMKPNDGWRYCHLGAAYLKFDRYQEAIGAFKQATRLRPDYAWGYQGLGDAYSQFGQYRKALEAFKQAIRINPADVTYHYDLGYTYGKLGRWHEAIKTYKVAIQINPDIAWVHYGIGNAYLESGRDKDALEAFKQAVRIDPDFTSAHYNMGLTYVLLNDRGNALEQYKILKTIDKESANKLFNLIYE